MRSRAGERVRSSERKACITKTPVHRVVLTLGRMKDPEMVTNHCKAQTQLKEQGHF